MSSVRFLNVTSSLAAFAALLAGGCGSDKSGSTGSMTPLNVPTMPNPMPGQASIGGHALDASGVGVAGATVKIAETDQTTTTDSTGAYSFAVLADSTLTLTATAMGMANTYRESVILAAGSAVTDFDVRLLTTGEMSGIDSAGQAAGRGLVALRLHSMNPACVTAGAHVTVSPPSAATVVYSAPASTTDALDIPDPTIQEVQDGAQIAVWLMSALPPGNMNLLRIDVQRNGCQLMAESPSLAGLTFPGRRVVLAKSLTEADLFLQQAP